MIFDDLDYRFFKIFPPEIWLIIKKFYIRNYLTDNLLFPELVVRRMDHAFFADYWQAYMRHHRWDIEVGNISLSALVSQHFKGKRLSIEWSGDNMQLRERVFGIGFNISQLFLDTLFMDEDYVDFLPSIEMNSESDNEEEFDLFD